MLNLKLMAIDNKKRRKNLRKIWRRKLQKKIQMQMQEQKKMQMQNIEKIGHFAIVINHVWKNLKDLFDEYHVLYFPYSEYGSVVTIRNIRIALSGKGIGSYQVLYLVFNSNASMIFIDISTNDQFWDKFLIFGGEYYARPHYDEDMNISYPDLIQGLSCGYKITHGIPTLKSLIETNDIDNIINLYKFTTDALRKYNMHN